VAVLHANLCGSLWFSLDFYRRMPGEQSTCYSCQILMKLDFSRWILESSNQRSNVMTMRPVGAEFLHAEGRMDGRTDRQDQPNYCFLQFCDSS
jgi:hypothetical protein